MTQLDDAHFHLHSANKDKMSNMNKFFANKNKKMLVDGDLLVYKITSSLEEAIDWGDDVWTLSSDLKKGKQLFTQAIAYYWHLTKSNSAIICFSDQENFRKKIDSGYKSHRKKIRKPVSYAPMRKWIEETHHTICYPNLEADDAIGLLATGEHKNNCVIISGDKDMRTIPAWQCCIIDDKIEYVFTNKIIYLEMRDKHTELCAPIANMVHTQHIVSTELEHSAKSIANNS